MNKKEINTIIEYAEKAIEMPDSKYQRWLGDMVGPRDFLELAKLAKKAFK